MHPAAMARAGHHRRPLTSDESRRAVRAQGAAAVVAPPDPEPSCAFSASAGAIIVARGFSVTYPFTGAIAAFATGLVVDLWSAREWAPCEQIVIVVERATIGDGYRLLALPSDVATRGDTVLGGFDLDASGAVLSGSFWDANLADDEPSQGAALDARPITTRMAEACITLNAERPEGATRQGLLDAGFTQDDIDTHFDDARQRANRSFVRDIADERTQPPAAEPQHMLLARMRVAVGALLPSRQFVVTQLQAEGFTKTQLDTCLREAIDLSGRDFSGIAVPPAMREVA